MKDSTAQKKIGEKRAEGVKGKESAQSLGNTADAAKRQGKRSGPIGNRAISLEV